MPRPMRLSDPVICRCGCKYCTICPSGRVRSPVSRNTFIEGKPVGWVGTLNSNCASCCCRSRNPFATGSPLTFIEQRPVALETSVVPCGIPIATTVLSFIN